MAECLLAFGESAEAHHLSVVGVVGSCLSVLIALVDTGHARDGEVDDLEQHRCFVCSLFAGSVAVCRNAYLARPAGAFVVLIPADSPACQRDEAALIVVAGDISHGVVGTVTCQGRFDGLSHALHRLVGFSQYINSSVVDIKIELRGQHTRLHIGADELVVAVGLSNHPNMPIGEAERHLLPEHTPVVQGDMLASVVSEAVEVVVRQPVEGGVGHGLAYLFALEVKRGDVDIEPCGQACLVP